MSFGSDTLKHNSTKRVMKLQPLSWPLGKLHYLSVQETADSDKQRLKVISEAMDQCAEFVLVCNRHGTIEYVNASFTRITGYEASEVLGKNPSILSSGLNDRAFYKRMWNCILGGNIWRGEVIDRRKDGSLYHADMSISPIKDDRGQVTHFVSIQRDITTVKSLEKELAQAKKMEAVGTLASGLAHDLNNILMVISGNVELAKMMPGACEQMQEHMHIVNHQVVRASSMISELLTFARKSHAKLEPLNLTEVVRDSVNHALTQEQQSILSFCTETTSAISQIDASMIQRVIGNLLRNAVDAMETQPEPALRIGIRSVRTITEPRLAHMEKTDGDWSCVEISDNGCGIAPEVMEKIFDPFFTTKDIGKGTGLGLACVYGAMQQHHGHIDVESEPGQGTTFRLYFPLFEKASIAT